MTTTAASAPAVITPAERAAAGRQAIADCPTAFENLRGDGDQELVDFAASNDENVNAALDTIGELGEDEAHLLGQYLAEQLVEDAIEAEARKQLSAYRAAQRTSAPVADQRLGYEPNDPKHPDFLDRLGV
ncbi:hypothetical protein [Paenarthrobacter sp. C1]|uniref:hypothetical protein n=1 Tax=Paenarthrobacter sp. C1 TaxID=3400220 RepID=UPI003BF60D70